MKKLLLLVTLLAPALAFAAGFEGKVNLTMTSGRGKPQQLAYNIKGDKIRLEMPGQKNFGGMIMDTSARQVTMIMDEQKMYMTMPIPDVAAAATGQKGDEVKLEKTSETEKILGYTATKYLSTHDGTTTELWLAEGLGAFMGFNNSNPMARGRGAAASPAWERALAGKQLFPLRVVGKDKGGKESFRMETTAIEKKSLPDSMFAPPADYKQFDMSAMMKGMMPGGSR